MARALNYIFLISIIAVIVAASGCSSNTSNNTQAPATATPAPATTTPETQVTPVETPTPSVTAASAEETPNTTENTTSTSTATGTYVENGTHISTTERNLQIEQSNAGVTSTVSNGTYIVKVSENSYGLETNPLSTAKKNTNPFNNTGNNSAVAVDTGKLKIIPAEGSATTTNTVENQTINLGTEQRKLQTEQAAQSGNSGSGASQNSTGSVAVNTASGTGY